MQKLRLPGLILILCLCADWRARAQVIFYNTSSATQSLNTIANTRTNLFQGIPASPLFTATGSNGVSRCTAIAVDALHRELFLADGASNAIWSLNLDGTRLALVRSGLTNYITDLALDTTNQRIYYTTSSSIQNKNAIWRMDYAGNNNTNLFTATGTPGNGVSRCTAIAVDAGNSKIFIADAGNQMIWSLGLNGSGLTALATNATSTPLDLTLNTASQQVYFALSSPVTNLNSVGRVNYNGSGLTNLVVNGIQRCTAIDYDPSGHYLYLSDAGTNQLWQVSSSGGQVLPVLTNLTATVKKLRVTAFQFTTTALNSSPNPSVSGQAITLTATVSPTAAGGSVIFFNGTNILGTNVLVNGVATLMISALPAGTNNFMATYQGAGNYLGSSSTNVMATVTKANARIIVSSSPIQPTFGQPFTLFGSVTAAPPGVGVPTGTFVFSENSTNLGNTNTLISGGTTLTNLILPAGTNSIMAAYSGDTNFNGAATLTNVLILKAPTTNALMATPNPAVFGQSVTFTVNVSSAVSSNIAIPTGGETFYYGTNNLGNLTLTNGMATLRISTLPAGTNNLTAVYSGDGNFLTSTSSSLIEIVHPANTMIFVSSSPGLPVFGQPFSLMGYVSAVSPGAGVPTGTLTFSESPTNILGTSTLINGGTSLTNLILPAGMNSITASYSGDANFNGQTWLTNVTILKATTTNVLTATPNPTVFGQPVTFTVTVTSDVSSNIALPTGTETFYYGTTNLGSSTLTNGVASLATAVLGVGDEHTITAVYSGDANFSTNTSAIWNQVVDDDSSITTLLTATNTTEFGQPAIFTVTVSAAPPGAGTPGGTVTFYYNETNSFATNVLVNGSTSITNSSLPVGTNLITAVYSGEFNFAASQSSTNQVVNLAATTNTLTGDINPSVFGQTVTFTVNISSDVSSNIAVPTGTETFFDGASSLGSSPLTNGTATLTISTLAAGSVHDIAAIYSGDTNFNTNTSAIWEQTVNLAASSSTVLTATNPTVFGQPAIFTVTVDAVAPGAGLPTGTVAFYLSDTNGFYINSFGTNILVNGVTSITNSALPSGTNLIIAIYSGDEAFNGSQAGTNQVVNQAATTNILVSDVNPSASGQAVTFTATVSPLVPGAGVPTGTMTFYANGTQNLGTNSLVDGAASLTNSTLAIGTNLITAVYSGDADFIASTASSLAQVVFSLTNAQTLTTGPVNFSVTNVLYLQTGLMQQLITVSNITSGVYTAVRVTLHLTQSGITVYNATGTDTNGDPYLQYNYPVPAHTAVTFAVEYYVANRTTVPNPAISVSITTPADPTPIPTGTSQTILQSQYVAAEGAFVIGFQTQLNATYYVLYSSDMIHWTVVLPAIKGTGSSVQWVDLGPPQTISRPDSTTSRYYQVIKAQ